MHYTHCETCISSTALYSPLSHICQHKGQYVFLQFQDFPVGTVAGEHQKVFPVPAAVAPAFPSLPAS